MSTARISSWAMAARASFRFRHTSRARSSWLLARCRTVSIRDSSLLDSRTIARARLQFRFCLSDVGKVVEFGSWLRCRSARRDGAAENSADRFHNLARRDGLPIADIEDLA